MVAQILHYHLHIGLSFIILFLFLFILYLFYIDYYHIMFIFYYYVCFNVIFFIIVYINLDWGWRRFLHIVNEVGGVRSKIYLAINVEMRFTLIVIRMGHHIIRIIFCEVRPVRGGIEIFTWKSEMGPLPLLHMDPRLVLVQHPSL